MALLARRDPPDMQMLLYTYDNISAFESEVKRLSAGQRHCQGREAQLGGSGGQREAEQDTGRGRAPA